MAKSFKTSIVIDGAGSAASEALSIKVEGDTESRILFDAGGKLTWGSGSASGDVTLYRSAANLLKTDDALQAVAGVINLTTDGAPSAASADGTIAIDTTNNQFYYRSSGTWTEVVSQSTTVADGGTSAAWVRYHIDADGNDSTGN